MINRIKHLPTIKTGERMDKIDEMVEMLRNSEGYLLGITTLKEGKLTHYLVTEKFHPLDILKSLVKIKEQAVESLEKERPVDDKDVI